MSTHIVFGQYGNWCDLVAGTIDRTAYRFVCADFATSDLADADAIVPLSLRDAALLRERHAHLAGKFLIPSACVIDLCDDKQQFNRALSATEFAGLIPPPGTDYPFIVKPRHGESGGGSFIVADSARAARHAAAIASPDYLCQTVIPGRTEYATHMLMAGGRLLYHSTNAYHMAGDYEVLGQHNRPVREQFGVDAGPATIERFTALLRALDYEGACCIDHKFHQGRVTILELNPRCGFSLFRDINAFLRAYLAALAGRRAECGAATSLSDLVAGYDAAAARLSLGHWLDTLPVGKEAL